MHLHQNRKGVLLRIRLAARSVRARNLKADRTHAPNTAHFRVLRGEHVENHALIATVEGYITSRVAHESTCDPPPEMERALRAEFVWKSFQGVFYNVLLKPARKNSIEYITILSLYEKFFLSH